MAFIISASESGMGDRTGQCSPLPAPLIGTLKLVSGDGTSVGSVMSLQCPNTHHAGSGAQVSCVWSRNDTHWSGETPQCKPLSRLEDDSFRLAVLVSFISATIILLMSIIFITSCLVKHVRREERRKMERARKNGASEVDLQREPIHNQKNTNNNNNNNNYTQLTTTDTTTDKQIYTPCRCVDEGKPYPQIIHLKMCQISVILSPPADRLLNTHTGAGHTHFCQPLLQEPVWTRPHTPAHHMWTDEDLV
ncbi:sushi domain-containing protein 3 isoform X2 [Pimephales promelas]|uniref:sushi domain-containing protein 3 isoform X2 n=1 Tax=Pimephales promelas TaxID=90988 RepID=UPI001955EEE5|nr:sushi domain-containing protein 3 isoform X2 [Pimephales promelas]KAG1949085.1 sushi domain-containing protein [Pimephales promelas]